MDPPEIPDEHPRVYVRPEDLPDVREKTASDELAAAWNAVRTAEDQQVYCDAFVSLVADDTDRGRRAIEASLARLEGDDTRRAAHGPNHFDHELHEGACVYDWCYDLLTDEERRRFVAEFKRYAGEHAPGYPAGPADDNPIVGHASEGWLMTGQLPAGVAIHDEDPEMYTHAAERFFSAYAPPRNFFYPGHMHHQGTDYTSTRCVPEIAVAWLFRRLGADDVFVRDLRYVPYWYLYAYRPDRLLLKQGDDFDPTATSANKAFLALMVGNYYDDPYLRAFGDRAQFRDGWNELYSLWELLFSEPGAPRASRESLPTTKYFGSPIGEMIARTGWGEGTDSDDAVVQMRIGEHYFGNHQHHDFGTFQIYCGGPLAIDSGHYGPVHYGSDHWRYYLQLTLAHNGLLVFDPETEDLDYGGQRPEPGEPDPESYDENYSPSSFEELRSECNWGAVTGRAFGPERREPTYSYIAGDVTGAYYDTKVDRVTRSMVTLRPTDERYPCLFAVHDDVVATDPSFRKAWVLHSLQEPDVSGARTTIVSDGDAPHGGQYHGKLVAETLRPEDHAVESVGGEGRECWNPITGANHPSTDVAGGEMGAWRVEVSPTEERRRHQFLHVLSTMPSGADAPPVESIESGRTTGARVLDRAVLFNATDAPLTELDVTVPGDGDVGVFVDGLAAGRWIVRGPGVTDERFVSDRSASLYVDGAAGDYRLERT